MPALPSLPNPIAVGRRAHRPIGWLLVALACSTLLPAQAQDWPQFQFDASRVGHNVGETAFTPDNVRALRVEFHARFGLNAANESGPVIAGGRLFVGGLRGKLSAIDVAGCGTPPCGPMWQGVTGGRITSTPAASNGVVAIAADDKFLHVFSQEGCGEAICAPLWRGRLGDVSIDASVAAVADTLFVGDFSGRLSAFALGGCGHEVCDPLWTGQGGLPHEHMVGTPAVGAGFVFVQTTINTVGHATGRLLAFPQAGCGESSCEPSWIARLGGPSGSTSSPVVVGDKVIVGSALREGDPDSGEHLFAFAAAGCRASVCSPIQTFDPGQQGIQTAPAVSVDGTTLFASSSQFVGAINFGVVAAYDLVHCGAHCKPMWTGVNKSEGGFSPPAIAGDVVFVGTGLSTPGRLDAGVYAFDARGCGKPQCQPLTFVRSSSLATYFGAPLAVGDGKVLFVSADLKTFSSDVTVMSLP